MNLKTQSSKNIINDIRISSKIESSTENQHTSRLSLDKLDNEVNQNLTLENNE